MRSFKEEIGLETSPSETESQLIIILDRLGAVLVDETEQLERSHAADHQGFIVAKNQALRELMSIQHSVQVAAFSSDTVEKLQSVRKLVDRNHQLLKLQVSALNDVTSFLTQAAISELGDGTYGRNQQ